MGGIGSGQKRRVHRGSVEQFPSIDLRILKRAGLLRFGECTYDTLCWLNQGLEQLSARIFIDLSDADDAFIKILSDTHQIPKKIRAAIECVPCPLGGYRCYFLCPLEGTRCEQLFWVDGAWASRKAHKLTYASQSKDELSRARRKVAKLHRQVAGDIRYKRPRGSNRRRRVKQLKRAESQAQELYLDKLRSIAGIE